MEPKWNTLELPEENRIILIYDMMEGLKIGYYDSSTQEFYDLLNNTLRNTCAWLYIPEKPKTFRNIQDTIRQRNYIDTVKKTI